MPNSASGPLTVFIAEDNPILLEGLERALTANGYQVATSTNGDGVIRLLKTMPLPDVLLLDVMMPGMSGIEVLDAVREDPRTATLPVLLITAAADDVVSVGDLAARGVEVLLKPFRLSELLSRIEALGETGALRGSSGRTAQRALVN